MVDSAKLLPPLDVRAALTVPYLSPAWGEQAITLVRTDARIKDALAGTEVSVLTLISEAPPGRLGYLYAHFTKEGGSDLRVGTDPAPLLETVPKPSFTIRGAYATFAAIQRGELSEKKAWMHGDLAVEGHKLRMLALMRPLQTITAVLATIPCAT